MYDQARRLFQHHLPQDTFRSQPASDWCGLDPLPFDLATYYERVGPDGVELLQFANPELLQFANPIYLPSLRDLWMYQEPHQFNITTWELEPTWHEMWFYLADLQNDEYGHLVFDAQTGQVRKVVYDEPGWVSRLLVDNLQALALSLAVLSTPISESLSPRDYQAQFDAILVQLRQFLSNHEIHTLVTELKWRYAGHIM